MICGVCVTMFALFIMGGTHPTDDEDEHKEGGNKETLIDPKDKKDDPDTDEKEKKHLVFEISAETIKFQLAMMLAAVYYSMLCTNWLNPGLYTTGQYASVETWWLKISCLWITIFIYFFSQLAPLCFPDRDFQ